MGRYLARILKTLFVALFGVGGGIGLMTFIALTLYSDQQAAVEIGLQSALVVGLSFGSIVATALVLTDLTMRLSISNGPPREEIWELEQSREIELTGSIRDVKRHCREALMMVPNLKSVLEESSDLSMKASIGRSWRSPGEEVQVVITPAGDGRFKILCTSHCVQRQVAFDYAKNFENVETWLRHMSRFKGITAQS